MCYTKFTFKTLKFQFENKFEHSFGDKNRGFLE